MAAEPPDPVMFVFGSNLEQVYWMEICPMLPCGPHICKHTYFGLHKYCKLDLAVFLFFGVHQKILSAPILPFTCRFASSRPQRWKAANGSGMESVFVDQWIQSKKKIIATMGSTIYVKGFPKKNVFGLFSEHLVVFAGLFSSFHGD